MICFTHLSFIAVGLLHLRLPHVVITVRILLYEMRMQDKVALEGEEHREGDKTKPTENMIKNPCNTLIKKYII